MIIRYLGPLGVTYWGKIFFPNMLVPAACIKLTLRSPTVVMLVTGAEMRLPENRGTLGFL